MIVKNSPAQEQVEILVVEDSRTQAERLKYLLEQERYRVMVAENGSQALALLSDCRPTLVITDIIMPEMNGYDLCRRIKSDEHTQEIPVILLTSLTSSEDVLEGLACGADNFITKPYSEDYLLSSIEKILAGRKLRKSERVRIGVEILFAGKSRFITADQQQMLGLLISTYEAAVQRNTELVKAQDELRALNERLEDLVEQRTAELSKEIVERKRAEEREKHLNAVLRAIRGVNQLITREKHRERLIHEACETLTSTRGFRSVWIALVDEAGAFLKMAESGLSQDYLHLMEGMKRGEWPRCAEDAFVGSGVVVIEGSAPACRDCPLASYQGDHGALAIRLEHEGKVYGIIVVSLPRDMLGDTEEQGLFREVAGDVAFALYNYEREEERSKTEDEKKKIEEQFIQAQKLEAIGRLTGGIAHDFNNLLTTIIGNAEMALSDMGKEDPLYEVMEEIRNAGARAASLTRQLLAFSRKQILHPEVVDLNEVVGDMDRILRRIIGEDIEIRTILDPGLGEVKVDPNQIEQVLMNLAVNARDAMPKGGKLTIETSNVELDEAYARNHISVIPGPYVMLAVSDTGVGMSKEVQDQLFEPFFTTKEKGKGTGLGLSTVYGIIKQSKGNIWVYSEPGKGSTFKIYFPRVEEPGRVMESPGKKEEALQGEETILLVEDDEMVRNMVLKALKRYGYTVLCAANGQEAIHVCQEHKAQVQLMLTDVVMPGISGRDLAEELKDIQPEMKVLFMSGYTDEAIVHHGILEEGIAFIQKPFTPEGLARKVREVLGTRNAE